jgi:GNAT superfamily N-acetyltransferase
MHGIQAPANLKTRRLVQARDRLLSSGAPGTRPRAAILRASPTNPSRRVTIAYSLHQAPFDPSLLRELTQLARAVFNEPTLELEWRLGVMPNATAVLARDDGRLVGFKLGYAMTESKYYSWLGGVHLAARGSGVARQLMRRQHRWLKEMGCSLVETTTDQGNAAMARVNLQEGFAVCGTRSMPGRTQVIYLKQLK